MLPEEVFGGASGSVRNLLGPRGDHTVFGWDRQRLARLHFNEELGRVQRGERIYRGDPPAPGR